MDEKIKAEINNDDLKEAFEKTRASEKENTPKKKQRKSKSWVVFLIIGLIALGSGFACILVTFFRPQEERDPITFPEVPSSQEHDEIYSLLTGEVLADAAMKNSPVYCIQVPNGTDGARPQSGLTGAGVIFEAIAEAGITRFAAIYQNPTQAVIGPIRSLRIYYLDWDTPFNCTIVHAGGAADALAAVRSGGYRDLTENYQYMYRGTNRSRLWNNLFTTATNLKQSSLNYGYESSDLKGFSRLTPEASRKERVDETVKEKLDITKATENNTSELIAKVANVRLRFGWSPNFNVSYSYDSATNTYKRGFENGMAHEVYQCPDENLGEVNPEGNCSLVQMSPSVVIAMIVDEKKAAGGYYESIPTIGSDEVYIFQNGIVQHGTWNKASRDEQIKFFDESGKEILLAPGQTFISAVPRYGGVEF